MEKFAKCIIQTGCLYSGSTHSDWRASDPSQPFGLRESQGGFLPRQHQQLAGKIRPTGSRWSAVEFSGSKPTGWWTGLVAEKRGGAHQKACLRRRGSAAGKGRRQAGVGVSGGVRAVGEEVLDDVVLGVGSRQSEEG
jgi:hypothetical protein